MKLNYASFICLLVVGFSIGPMISLTMKPPLSTAITVCVALIIGSAWSIIWPPFRIERRR